MRIQTSCIKAETENIESKCEAEHVYSSYWNYSLDMGLFTTIYQTLWGRKKV